MNTRNIRIACFLRFALLIFVLQACSGDNESDGTNYRPEDDPAIEEGTITEEFRPLVERFIAEMNQRGKNISARKLSVVFVNEITMPNSERFCAYGYVDFQNSGNPRVEIINNEQCWGRRNPTEKENLMFHELGHALLQKGHLNGTLPNGAQKSIMCASETCNNYRVYNSYQNEQRAYYLDELVNSRAAVPDWATEKKFSRTLDEDTFDNGITEWGTEIGEDPNTELPYDFYVENDKLFSPPNALAIRATSDFSINTFGHWQKTYPISDFEYCSNISVRADIITENLSAGSVGISIELLENNTENEFEFFARYSNAVRGNDTGSVNIENFEAQSICLPEETAAIRVLLYMNGVTKNSVVTFDNLEIEVHE